MGEMFNLGLLRRIFDSEVIRDLEHTYRDINRLEQPYFYSNGRYSNFNTNFSNKTTSFIKRLGLEEDNARVRQNIPSLQQRRTFQNDLRKRNRF